MKPIGMVAGWGRFPTLFAEKARSLGQPLVCVGIRGHASNYIELIVALIEGVLLVGFAVPLWAKAVDHFPTPDEHPTNIRQRSHACDRDRQIMVA